MHTDTHIYIQTLYIHAFRCTYTHKHRKAHFASDGCLLLLKRWASVKALSSVIQLYHFHHSLINQPHGLILQELRIKGFFSCCQTICLTNVREEDKKNLSQG